MAYRLQTYPTVKYRFVFCTMLIVLELRTQNFILRFVFRDSKFRVLKKL